MSDDELPPVNGDNVDSNAPGYRVQDYAAKSNANASDLDDILNLALDELENNEIQGGDEDESGSPAESVGAKTFTSDQNEQVKQSMNELLRSLQDPTIGDTLGESLKALSGTQEGISTINDYVGKVTGDKSDYKKRLETRPGGLGNVEATQGDRTVSKLLNDMSNVGGAMEGMEASQMEDMGGTMMNQMMAEFEVS